LQPAGTIAPGEIMYQCTIGSILVVGQKSGT